MAITIRACKTTDSPAVLKFWRASTGPGVTDTPAGVRRRLARDGDLFLLAVEEKQIVGSVIGGWDGWRASMARLAVARGHRRRGVAQRLVAEIERRLRRLGARRISCIVLSGNRAGRRFWESADYRVDPHTMRYIKDLKS